MPSIRDLRSRIISVEKTQKVTRAMKMVAAAKLARATRQIAAARPYAVKLREVLGAVTSGVESDVHPLLTPRSKVENLEIVLFTSDRGLCGGYNSGLIKHAKALIAERREGVKSITMVPVGRRAADGFKRVRDVSIEKSWSGIADVRPSMAREIAEYVMQRYSDGSVDEVVLVYSEFESALTQKPGHEQLLPLATDTETDAQGYEIEPDPAGLLGRLIPRAVEFAIFRALLENQAGEHGARMTAMDSATSNSEELIDTLTLQANKARQAAITAELMEIVSGAEAL